MLLIRVIGVFIGCMGLFVAVNPGILKRMVAYWRQGKRIYLGGLLRLLFGMAFLFSAPYARLPAVVAVFGIFSLLTGTLALVLGVEKTKRMLDWWDTLPQVLLRFMGLVVLVLGSCIVYSA